MATTLPPRPDHPPTPGAGRARPEIGRRLLANLSTAELVEDAIRAGEGVIAADGPLVVRTGKHTGRSPQDKFIVDEPIDPRPDLVGRRQPAHQRGPLRPAARAPRRLLRREGPVRPGPAHRGRSGPPAPSAGPDRDRLGEHLRAQPVPPPGRRRRWPASSRTSRSCACPSFQADPATEGTRTGTAILLHLERMEIIIVGTEYAGEIKKSAFTVMNHLMPDEGVLPMHSSVNVGEAGDSVVFFGLSGTGKTTLSRRSAAQPHRRRRARLGAGRAVQLRGRLLRQDHPAVADVRAGHLPDDAPLRDGPRERRPGPAHPRAGPRLGALHREHPRRLPAALHRQRRPDRHGRPSATVILLTADAFGVLPPIARLTHAQAAYHFISGYTAKLAGTEVGVTEPQGHVQRLLRGAVHAPPPGPVRGDADRAPGRARRHGLARQHGLDRRTGRGGGADEHRPHPGDGPGGDRRPAGRRPRCGVDPTFGVEVPTGRARTSRRRSSTRARRGPIRPPTTRPRSGSPGCSRRTSWPTPTASTPDVPAAGPRVPEDWTARGPGRGWPADRPRPARASVRLAAQQAAARRGRRPPGRRRPGR